MKNSDMPAMPAGKIKRPVPKGADPLGNHFVDAHGLTKLENFCLECGVPETGDTTLDAIIIKGNRAKAAAMAMQGILANPSGHQEPEGAEPEMMLEIVAFASASFADALLAELKHTK